MEYSIWLELKKLVPLKIRKMTIQSVSPTQMCCHKNSKGGRRQWLTWLSRHVPVCTSGETSQMGEQCCNISPLNFFLFPR